MHIEEIVKRAFDPYVNIPMEEWKSFISLGDTVMTKKDETVKFMNTTEKYLYLILKGSGGVMLWNNNKFVCTDLCYEGEFFGDFMSFFLQKPTFLEVLTFESTELFRISKSNFDKLLHYNEHGSKILQLTLEALVVQKQIQQIEMTTKTATERYIELLTKKPDIISRTPQKYIASYLGIQTQSLSRIRKNVTNNHQLHAKGDKENTQPVSSKKP